MYLLTTPKNFLPMSSSRAMKFKARSSDNCISCDTEYNLARCEDYVYRQSGNAIDTLIKIKGIETVFKELRERKPKPNIKYVALVNDNSKAYEDPILVYLRDRGAL